MRNISLKSLAVVGVAFATLSSCNSMKDLDKNYYTVNPNPLEVHGGMVKVDVKGQFPEKLFKTTVAVEVTPVLKYEGGESQLKMAEFQGEEYPGNATVIPYETGKIVSYSDEVAYTPEMQNSELYVNVVGKKGDKRKEFDELYIAPGVITTSLLVEDDYLSSFVPPAYEQTTEHELSGMVNFKVNSSEIRNSELKELDYQAVADLVDNAGKSDKLNIDGVSFTGYASPEGEASKNADLSDNRAENVEKKITSAIDDANIEYQDGFFTKEGKGADWDGVYAAIKESNIEDKDMILRSLDDQPLLDSKEATLVSLANTYDEIRDSILPKLRRTQISINYTLIGKTDEEIKALSA
ncbi:MAG: OmpA family protein, partial [Flavobacteriales bacterium]|nr:OmpA family protein [Flavobacteriales bacterium]